VALEAKVVHVPDCLADPEFTLLDHQHVGKFRTMLGVPLLRENVCVGVIGLLRNVVQPFSDVGIDLVTTFADQAVIAIENARLFEAEQPRTHELQELSNTRRPRRRFSPLSQNHRMTCSGARCNCRDRPSAVPGRIHFILEARRQ
jgi:GAF domain-containing protein